MKVLNKIILISAGLFFLIFSACTEDFPEREPSPEANPNAAGVYFPSSNVISYELDPTDPTSVPVTVTRGNAAGAITVPITVLKNTENIFNIPESVSFAAGDTAVTFNVTFPDAVVGKNYTFDIALGGEDVDPYTVIDGAHSVAVSVIRVKWDNLGEGQFYDSFTMYSIATVTIEYTENLDLYRIANPYSQAILEEAEWEDWIGGPSSDYITFTITSAGKIVWEFWYLGVTYEAGGTPIKAYLPSVRNSANSDNDALSAVDADNSKLLILNPEFFVDGLGGFGLNPVYISLPGGPDLNDVID